MSQKQAREDKCQNDTGGQDKSFRKVGRQSLRGRTFSLSRGGQGPVLGAAPSQHIYIYIYVYIYIYIYVYTYITHTYVYIYIYIYICLYYPGASEHRLRA